MAKKNKVYVVWKGKRPGIYPSWADCKAQINGVKGARYKAFASFAEAQKAFSCGYEAYAGMPTRNPQPALAPRASLGRPNYHSIAVDAACSGNPGTMEYRGVDTKTGKVLFHQGPFAWGTNNVGEFLALVHGLAFLKQQQSDRQVYSDSKIAMGWVKQKKCKTKLKQTAKNAVLFELIARAERWLHHNAYTTPIVKWETRAWGEIPADFGRK